MHIYTYGLAPAHCCLNHSRDEVLDREVHQYRHWPNIFDLLTIWWDYVVRIVYR